jgi:hypothetical protein
MSDLLDERPSHAPLSPGGRGAGGEGVQSLLFKRTSIIAEPISLIDIVQIGR